MDIPPNIKKDWLDKIDEHKGTNAEKNLLVPYKVDDVYNALLKLPNKIAHGKLFEEDKNSHSVLFGAKKSLWTGGITFKGYATLEAVPDGGTLIYMFIKRVSAEPALQELLNLLTDTLESEYAPSTTYKSLNNAKDNIDSSLEIEVYGSGEYDGKRNVSTNNKGSAASGVYYLIIGIIMMLAGFSGNFVLRFTNSSEALILFSLIPIGYGIYKIVGSTKSAPKHKYDDRIYENASDVQPQQEKSADVKPEISKEEFGDETNLQQDETNNIPETKNKETDKQQEGRKMP